MSPERWEQIQELYDAALELDPTQRSAFLKEACGDDEELCREVEALLASHGKASSFLETPALGLAAQAQAAETPSRALVGKTLGAYQILSLLGSGGMGEVYKARDSRLNRSVAIKVLPPDKTSDAERKRRFVQEARAASALNHPNIINIYDIGREDGIDFIVMEYVEGKTLDRLILRRGLKLNEVLKYSIQIADGLAKAHSVGIIHRDLKPGNVMVTDDGRVKVLDFGLAKLTESQRATEETQLAASTREVTEPGTVMGTLSYMSPEQAEGKAVDARSDIFSFGSLLYEMVTGQCAFQRDSMASTLAAILNLEPKPITKLVPGIPSDLKKIIGRCLRKDRERRFQHMDDLKVALQELTEESDSGGLAGNDRAKPASRRGCQTLRSLAILPFLNESADPNMEYLSDGITESLIRSLSELPKLRVMARSTVFLYKGKDLDPRKVGHDLDVQAAVIGSVRERADILVISVEMVDVKRGSQLWGAQYSRKPADILAIQEEISKEISDKLRLRLTGAERKRLTKRYTENIDAYQAYLKGRYHWNKRTEHGFRKGTEHFNQAIEEDPSYALAYAGLSDSYNLMGLYVYQDLSPKDSYPKAKAAAMKAIEIDEALAEPHASLAWVRFRFDWNWPGSEEEFKRAIELNSRYPTAYHWYAYYLACVGRLDEGQLMIERAHELDPLSLIINATVGQFLYYSHQYDRAIEHLKKTLELDTNFGHAHRLLGEALGKKGMFEEGIAEMEKAVTLSGGSRVYYLAQLAKAYAVSGRTAEALKILDELTKLSQRKYVSPTNFAIVYIGLGKKDPAFNWLEQAYQERSSFLTELKMEPMFDSLRSDLRFQNLLERMHFVS